ncbi:formin-like protein 5 [Pyrgilauda ruficollis]|uniref:formin-like protein 5 n=1 Tax=Pyrgilauda ruficollis TaxID=221976 RepID=UPI001B87F2C4|nr:formin-like protein 5 [Pyrgilauda ruficollis]
MYIYVYTHRCWGLFLERESESERYALCAPIQAFQRRADKPPECPGDRRAAGAGPGPPGGGESARAPPRSRRADATWEAAEPPPPPGRSRGPANAGDGARRPPRGGEVAEPPGPRRDRRDPMGARRGGARLAGRLPALGCALAAAAPAAAPAAAGQGEAEAAATPYVGLRRPLGYKLAKATKERIWRGEFIDLFSLLHTELAPEHGPRPGDTLDQWVSAFLVYASVLCEKHPARCGAMFKYLDTIRKLHATYGGTSWMNYDEDFRRRAAKNPSLPWGDVDLDLWMKWMAPLKSLVPRRLRAESETQASPAQPPPPGQSPKQEEKSQTP